MQIPAILRIIGMLLMMFSLSMVPPALISLWFGDGSPMPYVHGFILTFGTGVILWGFFRREHKELKTRDGFLIVVLFWFVLCFFAALPMMIAPQPHDTLTDAMFESVSGFTTTGATVVHGVDKLPYAMRYYRQQLQFIGGMGIIVLAVAILPMLGVGGMQLYRAETPGPLKDSKLTPRITSTAKRLWYIYVGLNVLCAFCFWLCGLSWFDAIGESFATISTGGFSMHDASFAYHKSNFVEMVAVIFMILGATNFSLHFLAIRGRSLKAYWQDEEFRAYIIILALISLSVAIVLIADKIYADPTTAVVKAIFNVVSMASTTGFVSGPFSQWPSYLPIIIMIGALFGGCAGSTSGGIKIIRVLLLQKQTTRELKRLVHPQAVVALKFGGNTLPERVLQSMWGFVAAFISLFTLMLLMLMATGLDLTTAFGSLSAAIANAGAGIGKASTNFQSLSKMAKWILIFAMLLGRLEIFTLLVLFTPEFWRK